MDCLHFARLVDRWIQNLRRCAGYRVQYFAAVEPQHRAAPHLHVAIRGAIPRALLRHVTAATYVQLWWPSHDTPVYTDRVPRWDGHDYVDPDTGTALPTWGQALDLLDQDPQAQPAHVLRLGDQLDMQGIIAPSEDADRAVRYLTKYLTLTLPAAHAKTAGRPDRALERHLDRLQAEVRWLPCSPACANWLRNGVQPHSPGPGLVPGRCLAKGHEREYLGLGGRRVLVSRRWTGKTLDQHRADRAAIVHEVLIAAGVDMPDRNRCAADQDHLADGLPRYRWEPVDTATADYKTVIRAAITEARRWRQQYEEAKACATGPPGPVDSNSATPSAA